MVPCSHARRVLQGPSGPINPSVSLAQPGSPPWALGPNRAHCASSPHMDLPSCRDRPVGSWAQTQNQPHYLKSVNKGPNLEHVCTRVVVYLIKPYMYISINNKTCVARVNLSSHRQRWQRHRILHVDGLMQARRNSSALAMELRHSCINPLTWLFQWTFLEL